MKFYSNFRRNYNPIQRMGVENFRNLTSLHLNDFYRVDTSKLLNVNFKPEDNNENKKIFVSSFFYLRKKKLLLLNENHENYHYRYKYYVSLPYNLTQTRENKYVKFFFLDLRFFQTRKIIGRYFKSELLRFINVKNVEFLSTKRYMAYNLNVSCNNLTYFDLFSLLIKNFIHEFFILYYYIFF